MNTWIFICTHIQSILSIWRLSQLNSRVDDCRRLLDDVWISLRRGHLSFSSQRAHEVKMENWVISRWGHGCFISSGMCNSNCGTLTSIASVYSDILTLVFFIDVQKGAFSIAAKTKVPVVPITLIGTGKIMPAGSENIVNPGNVKVIVHRPIEGSNPEALCNEARSAIACTLDV